MLLGWTIAILWSISAVYGKDFQNRNDPSCVPMWSENDIVGSFQSGFLKMKISSSGNSNIAAAILNFHDLKFVGVYKDGKRISDICTEELANQSLCPKDSVDQVYVDSDNDDIAQPIADANKHAPIVFKTMNATEDSMELSYNVSISGYYCVYWAAFDEFAAEEIDVQVLEKHQPYGSLPAERYGYLLFYGIISVFYLIVALLWFGVTAMYWREILPVQNWIAALIFVLLVDNAISYGFYQNWNGSKEYSTTLLFLMVICNSARNAAAIFCLLILSLGYGVVKPNLGHQMKYCIVIGTVIFVAFVLFDFGSIYGRGGEGNSPFFFFFIIPLSIALTVSFYKIDTGLQITLKELEEKRQNYKITMFTWLRRVFLASIILTIFMTLILSAFVLRNVNDRAWFSVNWPTMWFWREGWMAILFAISFVSIIFLWRPTSDNRRYGLQELPGDEAEADDAENYDLEMMNDTSLVKRANAGLSADGDNHEGSHGNDAGNSEVIFELGDDVSPNTSPVAELSSGIPEAFKNVDIVARSSENTDGENST